MIGLTDREKSLAVAAQGPGTGICLALAELELWWERHRAGAPDVHELRLSIRVDGSSDPGDGIATVQAVADWLGVEKHFRHGVHAAQRRFGTGDDSIVVEAVYAPGIEAVIDGLRQEAIGRRAGRHDAALAEAGAA